MHSFELVSSPIWEVALHHQTHADMELANTGVSFSSQCQWQQLCCFVHWSSPTTEVCAIIITHTRREPAKTGISSPRYQWQCFCCFASILNQSGSVYTHMRTTSKDWHLIICILPVAVLLPLCASVFDQSGNEPPSSSHTHTHGASQDWHLISMPLSTLLCECFFSLQQVPPTSLFHHHCQECGLNEAPTSQSSCLPTQRRCGQSECVSAVMGSPLLPRQPLRPYCEHTCSSLG